MWYLVWNKQMWLCWLQIIKCNDLYWFCEYVRNFSFHCFYPGSMFLHISGGTEGSIFTTLHRGCWGFCAAKVAFSPTAHRLFSYQFLLGVLVTLWTRLCGRRGAEVVVLLTIKLCSAILVKTISWYLLRIYGCTACLLAPQKCTEQGRLHIWQSCSTA